MSSCRTKIYFVKLSLNVNIVTQYLLHRNQFLKKIMKWGPKGVILIVVDNDPQDYKLSCCVLVLVLVFSFISIAFGHAVSEIIVWFYKEKSQLPQELDQNSVSISEQKRSWPLL